ncbi:NFACT RNA binding domain-containing protein [Borreliella lanei]|uniref:Putative ribosome quality control (RQC) complex YloA/Tae2 family protein n=1 Tax=Borreliella lanei TaxID=373540 RepID=A0A7W9ZB98_9SPIR|nr:NFACT family protein [Borreliella lanei]MBB6208055.1 putative ribosome quality control (RQC) complex YloA/Tae2 family protein [Borreliella lanei]WKC86182.1 NFACT family protein [Borreliella lanei]
MSLNYIEINTLIKEIPFTNSLITKIIQPDYKSLILEIYNKIDNKKFKILISLNPNTTRFHITKKNFKKNGLKLRFSDFLKSKIQNGKIIKAFQMKNERIISLEILKKEIIILFIKLWPSSPNIIATNSNFKILDAYYRRPKIKEKTGEIFLKAKEINESNKMSDKKIMGLKEEYNNNNYTSYSEFLENYYESLNDQIKKTNGKELLIEKYQKELIALEKRIDSLKQQIKLIENIESEKEKGELILLNINKIQKGIKEINLLNYKEEKIKISLNQSLSPKENALQYFKAYKKGKNSFKTIQNQLKDNLDKFNLIQSKITMLKVENFIPEEEYNQEKTAIKEKEKTPKIGLHFTHCGFEILIGRSAKENDELLRHCVKGNDYWLHTRDYPGAYVFIKNQKNKTPSLDVLLAAGNLCVFYTKLAKKSGKADLYYTQVKNLRRVKNKKLGLVIPKAEKNLHIKLDENLIKKLKNQT